MPVVLFHLIWKYFKKVGYEPRGHILIIRIEARLELGGAVPSLLTASTFIKLSNCFSVLRLGFHFCTPTVEVNAVEVLEFLKKNKQISRLKDKIMLAGRIRYQSRVITLECSIYPPPSATSRLRPSGRGCRTG